MDTSASHTEEENERSLVGGHKTGACASYFGRCFSFLFLILFLYIYRYVREIQEIPTMNV